MKTSASSRLDSGRARQSAEAGKSRDARSHRRPRLGKASVTGEAAWPKELACGVSRKKRPIRVDRFSKVTAGPQDDRNGDGRGMALKLMGVPGKKILAGEREAQTQDFVMIDYRVLFRQRIDYGSLPRWRGGKGGRFFCGASGRG